MLVVDFSLAINNRTGKYFLGKDIISAIAPYVSSVVYGRLNHQIRNDFLRRVHGRLYHWENLSRIAGTLYSELVPRQRPDKPVLHLDPLTVLNYSLTSSDIVLCHDIGPVTHPKYFAPKTHDFYKVAYEKIKDSKCRMIFVSYATRDEFIRIYGNDFNSMDVIYIPIRQNLFEESFDVQESGKFFLTTGSLGSRKNQINSIRAFDKSGLAEKGYQYFLVGGDEPGADLVKIEAAKTEGVVVLGYVNDDELKRLYKTTVGFVLMSHLEGFGMPIAEAASYGAPCLVTRGGVCEEVGGSSVLVAEPDDIDEIAERLVQLSNIDFESKNLLFRSARNHMEKFLPDLISGQWGELVQSIFDASEMD